jgi:hypothetical protein
MEICTSEKGVKQAIVLAMERKCKKGVKQAITLE